jgi:DNA end-binding protein Ku
MAGHAYWKGFLRISLVSIPVKAYAATKSSEKISLNQLHAECHSRIQYRKTCPIHGEVSSDEIVSGYEFEKGKYVVIDPDELEKLRTERDKSIDVSTFVSSDEIDPLYHAGRNYYLLPDAPIGQKPYQLVHHAMAEQGVQAVAQVVLSKKEQLVLIRPVDDLLVMTALNFAAEVRTPASFVDELAKSTATKPEQQLTKQLIEAMTAEKFDLESYHDEYTRKLSQLIEARVAGQELVASPAQASEPQVINLMDAIKASMKQIKIPKTSAKPARKVAPSKTSRQASAARKTPAKKRKSG